MGEIGDVYTKGNIEMTDLVAPVGVVNIYATPMDLKRRLGITDTTHDATLWHLLDVASRIVEGRCGRNFYVSTSSRRFDVRDRYGVVVDDLIDVSQVIEDWDGDGVYEHHREREDYVLYPLDSDPQSLHGNPYHMLRVSRRRGVPRLPHGRAALQITGRWGYRSHFVSLSGYVNNGGSKLRRASRSLEVDDATHVRGGNTILIDREQMFVRQVAASVLTVERGVNGTVASEHSDGSLLSRLVYPAEVVESTLLIAIDRWRRRDGLKHLDELSGVYNALGDVTRLLAPYRKLSV